jgi:hypothetical protein
MNDTISDDENTEWSKTMSAHALDPQFSAAAVLDSFSTKEFGNLDLNTLMSILTSACQRIASGNLADIEAMLFSQATALQSIFTMLAMQASRSPCGYKQVETYLRLALKSQNQCRATLETLAAMKTPRQVAFVAQANIAHGPQQVNNFPAQAAGGVAPVENSPNELLEGQHGKRMDTGTTGTASGTDLQLAAVATVNRAKDCGR